MASKGQFVGLDWNRIRLDHGGSWVQIPSGARIFSEFSKKHFIYHVFVVSSLIIIIIIIIIIIRYNKETKFPVTPSFVLTHSSDSI